MGLAVDLFTSADIDEEFICPICQDVLQDPTLLQPCEHAFCASCIKDWRKKSNLCPCDRRTIAKALKPPRPFLNMLNKIELKCPFSSDGCGAVMQLEYFQDHDRKCQYNPENQKECEGGCGAVLTQFARNSGAHSCVEYLKDQWQVTKDDLRSTKADLVKAEQKLKQNENLQRDQEAKIVELEQKLQETQGKLMSTETQLNFAHESWSSTEAQLELAETQLQSSQEQLQKMKIGCQGIQEQLNGVLGLAPGAQPQIGKIPPGPSPNDVSKQALGERLYPLIREKCRDVADAGKVTGMILEMDNAELLHLLEDQQYLTSRVEEAVAVLYLHRKKKKPS